MCIRDRVLVMVGFQLLIHVKDLPTNALSPVVGVIMITKIVVSMMIMIPMEVTLVGIVTDDNPHQAKAAQPNVTLVSAMMMMILLLVNDDDDDVIDDNNNDDKNDATDRDNTRRKRYRH